MKIRKRIPIIIGIVAIGLIGLGYYLNMQLIPELKIKKVELKESKGMLAAKDQELRNLEELQTRFNDAILLQVDRALAAVPTEKEIPDVLFKLTEIADNLGMRTSSLTVSSVTTVSKKSNISSIDFTLAFSGSYLDVLRYLDRVETSLRLLNINNVTLSGSASTLEGTDAVITASVQGKAYFTPENEGK